MAQDPNVLRTAYVATTDPNGALNGIPVQLNQLVAIKAFFQAGHSYNISINVVTTNLVLLGTSGNPIASGVKTFTYTAQTSGSYIIEFVPDARVVAFGQPVNILIQDVQTGVPTNIAGGLSLSLANAVNNGNLGSIIANGGNTQQLFIHVPDGLPYAPEPDPASSPNAPVVNALYQQILGRAVDAGGLSYWVQALDQGSATLAQVRLSLANSDEAKAYVNMLFLQVLARPVDGASLSFVVNGLAQGNLG